MSSAAQDLREEKRHYKGPFDRSLTLEKMRSMLWAAAHHGHTVLVLGAYGCGAFRNDPWQISSLFWSLLGPGGEFNGRFKAVVFAVIKSRPNLEAFSSVFPWMSAIPPMAAAAAQPTQATIERSALTDVEKEVLKLAKKLREVFKLEDSLAAGSILPDNQKQKLSRKAEWIAEFTPLMASLPCESDVSTMIGDVLKRVRGRG